MDEKQFPSSRPPRSGPSRVQVAGLSAAVAGLLFLHNDWWNRDNGEAVLGWIPFDLLYHVAWVGLASLVLSWTLRLTWGRES